MKFKKHFINTIIIFSSIFYNLTLYGQVKSVMIGVNGLTCSACCRTVEKSIRKLSFVKDVQMNLENTEGRIFFFDSTDVSFSKIAKAVMNAGFSVRYLNASYDFNNIKISSGFCYSIQSYNLQFINVPEKILNNENDVKLLGQAFLPKNEFNKIKTNLVNSCSDKNKSVYFVTLP